MAEFNFNAMQQAVHDAHASMTDKHAEPSDVHYIPPSPDCMPPATGQPITPPEYTSHQAIVQERMSQLELQRVEQTRAEIASQLDALQQHAADTAKEQIAADLAASPFSAADIPVLKPEAVVRLTNSPYTQAALAASAHIETVDALPMPHQQDKGELKGTEGITIDNCPLLVWLAVSRATLDSNATGYVVERDAAKNYYVRPVSNSTNTVKVRIETPPDIPLWNEDIIYVVTAEQLRAARAELKQRANNLGALTSLVIRAAFSAFDAQPVKDSKRKRPLRSGKPVDTVTMCEALITHIQQNSFRKFGDRGAVSWKWPVKTDDTGRKSYAALSYDSKMLSYSFAPDSCPVSEWEYVANGRVNMVEFTRSNRTRAAAHDYVTLHHLINTLAKMALVVENESVRNLFFNPVIGVGDETFIMLTEDWLYDVCGNMPLHQSAIDLINQARADATWCNVITAFIYSEVVKVNAHRSAENSQIVSGAAAAYIVDLFSK